MGGNTLWSRAAAKIKRRLSAVRGADRAPTPTSSSAAVQGVTTPGLAPPPPDYDSGVRLRIFSDLLRPLQPGRLLDLGTGHGAFAVIANDLGWEVTAVDVREDRFPDNAEINWVEADVRRYDVAGYDLINMLGLLYHLGLNDQLDLLQKCAGTPTILDTHVTDRDNHRAGAYQGWLFREELTESTASWGNEMSFWPTAESLAAMLADCGYNFVFRLAPDYYPNRTFYLCI